MALLGCTSLERLPALPLVAANQIAPLSIPNARIYADRGDEESIEALAVEMALNERRTLGITDLKAKMPPNHFLAISGGGEDGAFGAGLLAGWTKRGDRPSFRIVTGISTGALTAPFAFLGSDYDDELEAVYTTISAADIFNKRAPLTAALAGDAMTDTAPLKELIRKYLDSEMIRRIGEEYGKGRLLLIATTNLDHGRSVIWNIGAIAKSTDPRARDLIIEILRASASIPGLFPPVMLDVTVDGKRYEEMHVDGGAIAQAFLYPPQISLKHMTEKRGIHRKHVAYIIRNSRLSPAEETVKRDTLDIAGQAISTMIASSGVNDAYRIYLTTKRDGVDFNLAYIDGGPDRKPGQEPFDQAYMKALFEHGRQLGEAGYTWHKTPPGYKE